MENDKPSDVLKEAVILVGGKGTRLQSVVHDRPKPLAEVLGRPFVEWLILSLRAQGVFHIVLSVGYMSEQIQNIMGDGRHLDVKITYAVDPFPLGTGGALRHALDCIQGERFLALNGDSYCTFDIQHLLDEHLAHSALVTLWLTRSTENARYGSVDVDAKGAVLTFREKSSGQHSDLINAGIYLIERKAVEAITLDRAVSAEKELFPSLIGRGLYAVVGSGPFLDIGTPESYKIASTALAEEFGKFDLH